jgi:hypothetical protein
MSEIKGLTLLPPAPGLCQSCACDHIPEEPHNWQLNQCHPGLQIVLDREAAIADARILYSRIRELSCNPRISEIKQEIEELEDELCELERDVSRNSWDVKCLTAQRAAILRAFALVPRPGQLSLFETEGTDGV